MRYVCRRDLSAGFAIRPSRPDDAAHLLAIWYAAVCATHDFLSPADVESIGADVADYVATADFTVAADAEDVAIGFLGMSGDHIDALFIHPAWHGRGAGRALIATTRAHTVDVNEQNPAATAFYQRLGFTIVRRSETDDRGRPFPLLHLARE